MVYLGVDYNSHVNVEEGLDLYFSDGKDRLVITKGVWFRFLIGSVWVDGDFSGDYNYVGNNTYSIVELTAYGQVYVKADFNGATTQLVYGVDYWFKYHTLIGVDFGYYNNLKRKLNYFKL